MPNTSITDSDIRALLTESAGANDRVQVALCHIALDADPENIPAWASEALAGSQHAGADQARALAECERVILAARSAS